MINDINLVSNLTASFPGHVFDIKAIDHGRTLTVDKNLKKISWLNPINLMDDIPIETQEHLDDVLMSNIISSVISLLDVEEDYSI